MILKSLLRTDSVRAVAFFVLVALGAVNVPAQESRATLSGTITDPAGAVVAGASVTLTARATGVQTSATTDDDGQFRFSLLPVGVYMLAVQAANFAAVEGRELSLRVGEERRVDVSLTVGSVGEAVTINAPITDYR